MPADRRTYGRWSGQTVPFAYAPDASDVPIGSGVARPNRQECPMRRFVLCFPLFWAAFAHSRVAIARRAPASFSLEGRVLDTTQARVSGAHVTVVADGEASGRETGTDQ